MKRVKSGYIAQTLLFAQNPGSLLPREAALMMNRQEVIRYKNSMERMHTKYAVIDETVQQDGSILIHVKKQLSGPYPPPRGRLPCRRGIRRQLSAVPFPAARERQRRRGRTLYRGRGR